jgi:ABC-type bacteriocin/lantibiotic exporter with double-glycine peptidase domain
VALARALASHPDVLILDEPTSALDAVNEALLESALASLPPETTVVVVSHRPTLLGRCDRFVRVEDGRIVATGAPEDVGLVTLVRDAGAH